MIMVEVNKFKCIIPTIAFMMLCFILIPWGEALASKKSGTEYDKYQYCKIDENNDGKYDGIKITYIDYAVTKLSIPDKIEGLPVKILGKKLEAEGLTSLTIPDSVHTIEDYAFYKCIKLSSVTFGNGLKRIGNEAFYGCKNLKSITIPDSVTSIGKDAFCDSGLTGVRLGSKVTNIDEAFGKTPWYQALKPDENGFVISDGVLIAYENPSEVIGGVTVYNTQCIIPAGVRCIADRAFIDTGIKNDQLESVSIPNSVSIIGAYAFSGCKKLVSITIPESVTKIGAGAFNYTAWLKNKQNENPFVIVNNILVDAQECKGDVQIPESVKEITQGVFEGNTNIKSITIPKSIKSLPERVFENCTNLNKVTIKGKLSEIPAYAFSGCKRLSNVEFSEGLINICEGAFINCTMLKKIYIPDGVTDIGASAFKNCGFLQNITLGNSVRNIGDEAFESCSNLKSIFIPGSVKNIGIKAFYKTKLRNVYYYGLSKDWDKINIGYDNELYIRETDKYDVTEEVNHHYIHPISDQVYTGKEIKPDLVIVTKDGTKEKKNTDYKVTYSNNKNVGVADVKITFSAINGGGEVIVHFNIVHGKASK